MREFNVIGIEVMNVAKVKLDKESMKSVAVAIGNCVYNGSRDVKLSSFAVDIYDGKTVVLDDKQLIEIKRLLAEDRGLHGYIYLGVVNYI